MVTGGKAGLLSARDREVRERAQVLAQPKHRALARVPDTRLRTLAVTGAGHNRRPTPVAAFLVTDHLRRLPHTVATKNERLAAVETLLAQHLPVLAPLPEPTGVGPEVSATPQDLRLWNDDQAKALAVIADVIAEQGSVPGLQLSHAGRKASRSRPWGAGADLPLTPADGGWMPLGPSPISFGRLPPSEGDDRRRDRHGRHPVLGRRRAGRHRRVPPSS
ncbi:hypothetical protein [Streptomyces sp. NPDC001880]